LNPPEREAKCREAQNSLAERIAKYQPLVIVTLLLKIGVIVKAAAIAANCRARPVEVS
jgi:hypothetical protein